MDLLGIFYRWWHSEPSEIIEGSLCRLMHIDPDYEIIQIDPDYEVIEIDSDYEVLSIPECE